MHGMRWSLLLTAHVKAWVDELDDERFGRVAYYLDLLAERGSGLCPPHSRRLGCGGRLRELVVPRGRRGADRLSYWLGGGGTVLVLTVGRWWSPRPWKAARARAALRQHQGTRRRGRRRGGACRSSGEEPA